MSGTGEHEPIEIELTSHDLAPDGALHAADPEVADAVVAESIDEFRNGRQFGFATLAIAAAAALVVGVTVGRLGGSGDSVASTESTNEVAVEPTVVATSDPVFQALDAVPPVPAPTTSRAPRSTSSVVEDRLTTNQEIEIHPAVAGLPIELVVATWEGAGLVIDLGAGTKREVVFETRFDGPINIVAGAGWWASVGWDWGRGVNITRDDGTVIQVENVGLPVMRSADANGMWVSTTPFGMSTGQMIEIDGFGVPTGRSVDLDGGIALAADPLGGVVVRGVGGDFSVRSAGATLLTRGVIVGVGATTLLVEECDEQRVCNLFVVDRASGERVELDTDVEAMSSSFAFYGPLSEQARQLSPDATKAIIVSQTDAAFPDEWVPPTASILDLRTGDVQLLGDFNGTSLTRWSPDGRFVFWVNGSTIEAFDVETGASMPVAASLANVGTFDVRPALPSVDPGSVGATSTAPTSSTALIEP